ncbi:MAG: family 43 glycosylhydrolase [Akkermansiaceae bacterium]|jgi:beta-xylosidase|nr:family 43 glycosylhydrolase [Akkermansiaceae bacterium]
MKTIALSILAAATLHAADFTWSNPCTTGPDWIRDCFILRVDDTYYLTGTTRDGTGKPAKDKWPGFFLWKSTDLKDWKKLGPIITNEQVTWSDEFFWAPEIRYHPTRKKYYFTFNADSDPSPDKRSMGMGLAVADVVTGPYTLLTTEKPITNNNDASLFFDDDGKDYLAQTGFNLAPICLDKLELTGPKLKILQGGAPGAWDDAKAINEGSCLFKINGVYHYFWSSNAWGYFVGYATATSVDGPWTKNPANPIWGAAKPEFRAKAGQPDNLPFNEVGHGTPFIGPDKRLWIAGHGHTIHGDAPHPYNSPRLCIDPLQIDPETGAISSRLSVNPQVMKLTATVPKPSTLGSSVSYP